MRELFPKYKRPEPKHTIEFHGGAVSLADGVTYRYSPIGTNLTPATSSNINRQLRLAKNARHFILYVTHSGGAGSNEAAILRIENITKGTTADFDHIMDFSSGINALNTECFIDCEKDDFIELQLITPVFATNPSSQNFGFHLVF